MTKQIHLKKTREFHEGIQGRKRPSNNQRNGVRKFSRNAGCKSLQVDRWKFQKTRYKEMVQRLSREEKKATNYRKQLHRHQWQLRSSGGSQEARRHFLADTLPCVSCISECLTREALTAFWFGWTILSSMFVE